MNSSPIKRSRISSSGVFLATIYFCSTVAANSQSQHENSIKEISQQIDSISKTLNANRKLLKSEQDKLADVEQKIVELQRARRETEQRMVVQRERRETLRDEAETIMQSQQANLAALIMLIKERYKEGAPNFLKMLLNQDNPHAAGRLQNYYRYFGQAQQKKFKALKSALSDVEALGIEQNSIAKELEQEQRQLDNQRERLQKVKLDRNERVSRLDGKVSKSQQHLARLHADRQRLDALLKKIVEKAAEIASIEKQRRTQAAAQPSTRPRRTPVEGGFKKQLGSLPPPVIAKTKYRFGNRLAASGMRAQGHFYNTQAQQPVASIFRGQVIFAGYLKGYGLLIIIDHGDDHISLYGHNEVLYKKVGDAVTTGETIATSGVSGGLKQPGLYFEIRHNAAPIDPTKWLSRG